MGFSRALSRSSTSRSSFSTFPRKKSATEVVQRLGSRDHQILMAEAALPDDPSTVVPVSFKVAHELRAAETDPKLADLVFQLEDVVEFRRPAHPLPVDRRHAQGLARPGPLPRAHRRAGSLGDGQRVRRDHRQDEEPVLRDAQHAGAARVRRRSFRSPPGRTAANRKCSSASGSASTSSTATAAGGRSSATTIDRPPRRRPRLEPYRHVGDPRWLASHGPLRRRGPAGRRAAAGARQLHRRVYSSDAACPSCARAASPGRRDASRRVARQWSTA